ncbi:hypothetical protein [Paenibacillus chungangensis]|uniref:Uncharacterized protein n=1 Tax=Paenibacillus chungangensis TaxID=696535 RepID=A0ABW3HP60_9BACL
MLDVQFHSVIIGFSDNRKLVNLVEGFLSCQERKPIPHPWMKLLVQESMIHAWKLC